MPKKILHFQIPMFEGDIAINANIVSKFITFITKKLEESNPGEFQVICSPFIPVTSDDSSEVFYNFEIMNTEELEKLTKK